MRIFNAECFFFFVLRLSLLFTFQSDFIYYAINCFWICAVKVRSAKLRNYLKIALAQPDAGVLPRSGFPGQFSLNT